MRIFAATVRSRKTRAELVSAVSGKVFDDPNAAQLTLGELGKIVDFANEYSSLTNSRHPEYNANLPSSVQMRIEETRHQMDEKYGRSFVARVIDAIETAMVMGRTR